MSHQKHPEPDLVVMSSISFYLNAFAELEDALRCTLGMLRRHFDRPSPKEGAKAGNVTEDCIAAQHLLQSLPPDRRPTTNTIDDALRRCLSAQAFCERVVAGSRSLNGVGDDELANCLPRPDELQREAGEMIGLAMKLLSLHALFRAG